MEINKTMLVALLITVLNLFPATRTEFADEMHSFDKECLRENTFECLDGSCILHEQWCDSHFDCPDGSDESFCPDQKPDELLCNVTHQYTCEDKKKCIPLAWICNNYKECDDGSDEANCTPTENDDNGACKGFVCKDGKCISNLWKCDGEYDCADRSDENAALTCRHLVRPPIETIAESCGKLPVLENPFYKCLDNSFCLKSDMMCDGIVDCKDGSDEGKFCDKWHTMCTNFICKDNKTNCYPDRNGPMCTCQDSSLKTYNSTTGLCELNNQCESAIPKCPQECEIKNNAYRCKCSPGYVLKTNHCFAPDPDPILFVSTRNDIRYLNIKTKEQVIVKTGLKQAHGVAFDGKYVYWVETASGHQSIVRAELNKTDETKQTLVGIGLEDPGDVDIDWIGGNIYFTDAERGVIYACKADGSICTPLPASTKHPRFVTLDPPNGMMYWADWHKKPVLMSARMDGSKSEVLVDRMSGPATGLSLDAPSGRLYFVDRGVKVIKLNDKKVYTLFSHPLHKLYALSVFENTVYWTDLTSYSIQNIDKIGGITSLHEDFVKLDAPIYDMHMYHPVMMQSKNNPCSGDPCSHLCLIASNGTFSCACPYGFKLSKPSATVCRPIPQYRPHALIVASGSWFTRIDYNSLGNPETHATRFDIGRVQSMAYDNVRDVLYLHDSQRRTINRISMDKFRFGTTQFFLFKGFFDVVDMDYDYVSDNLYILDAGTRVIEAVSLNSSSSVIIYRFKNDEIPISMCLLPDYGRILVAIQEPNIDKGLRVDSFGMDGKSRETIISTNLRGPHIRLRYAHNLDNVYISDEGNGVIDYIHPEGNGREKFRDVSTTINDFAVTDTLAFWTDRRTSSLYWADMYDTSQRIRRLNLTSFADKSDLFIQAIGPPPDKYSPLIIHPCFHRPTPCSHICLQSAHPTPQQSPHFTNYSCACPGQLHQVGNKCENMAYCEKEEALCQKSNKCIPKSGVCDGKKDCPQDEDEEGCVPAVFNITCPPDQVPCNDVCVEMDYECKPKLVTPSTRNCGIDFLCSNNRTCIVRSLVCNGHKDCPDGSDEKLEMCLSFMCYDSEYRCKSGACVLKTWICDGDKDCNDGSDEDNCPKKNCSAGFYQCRNDECIEMEKRCDGQQDCYDFSDEDDCKEENFTPGIFEEPVICEEWEYVCELNKSICLPPTARCNTKIDCPGGTDESGCDYHCEPRNLFKCKQEGRCISKEQVCDTRRDCADGSDEFPEACLLHNNKHLAELYPPAECHNGYLCGNGQCIEWKEVCDQTLNCFDGSDENGHCMTACENSLCSYKCLPTPRGPHCTCPVGFRANNTACEDLDECADDVCSQFCNNTIGSFDCSCYPYYAMTSDGVTCKAKDREMTFMYITSNSVKSVAPDHSRVVEFNDPDVAMLSDLDFDVRNKKLYVTSSEGDKLIEVNGTKNVTTVTNVGKPNKVALDWITGNVYFVDSSEGQHQMRVCHFQRKRCAILQKLPLDSKITALVLDPIHHIMFYCSTHNGDSIVWSASLTGREIRQVAAVNNCTGLAADSYKSRLYVAETGPSKILKMDYNGTNTQIILSRRMHLEAPHTIAIFEGYLYFLVANSFQLNRCKLFSIKYCTTYEFRFFDANTFVINHHSIQRNDSRNVCATVKCTGVCVVDDSGPQCLCDDGHLLSEGQCQLMNKGDLPLFNGWTYQDYSRLHQIIYSIISIIILLFMVYLGFYLYQRFLKKRREAAEPIVRFSTQNSDANAEAVVGSSTPESPTSSDQDLQPYEFMNPFRFVRDVWRRSFMKMRPVGTENLNINIPHSSKRGSTDTEESEDKSERKKLTE